jgi:hypothetical protein
VVRWTLGASVHTSWLLTWVSLRPSLFILALSRVFCSAWWHCSVWFSRLPVSRCRFITLQRLGCGLRNGLPAGISRRYRLTVPRVIISRRRRAHNMIAREGVSRMPTPDHRSHTM